MTFRWRRLERIATQLVSSHADEAQIRSAVNRAYYAAYGEAKDFVSVRGFAWTRGRGGSHHQVWDYLKLATGAGPGWQRGVWKAIGDAGDVLKQQRRIADYDSLRSPTLNDAQRAIAQAHLIIKRLAGLP